MGALQPVIVRRYAQHQAYAPIYAAMRAHVAQRHTRNTSQNTPQSIPPHEIWQLEHAPVFTQGRTGKAEHVLAAGDIPIVQTDRGGQVTYHGPGQLMTYCLFDLRALEIGVSTLVHGVESAIIRALEHWQVPAHPRADAPGVYVESGAKIASLGLRVTHALSYHGVALNVDMDLEPFNRINPCGYKGLAMTHLRQEIDIACTATRPALNITSAADSVLHALLRQFGLHEQHKIRLP